MGENPIFLSVSHHESICDPGDSRARARVSSEEGIWLTSLSQRRVPANPAPPLQLALLHPGAGISTSINLNLVRT